MPTDTPAVLRPLYNSSCKISHRRVVSLRRDALLRLHRAFCMVCRYVEISPCAAAGRPGCLRRRVSRACPDPCSERSRRGSRGGRNDMGAVGFIAHPCHSEGRPPRPVSDTPRRGGPRNPQRNTPRLPMASDPVDPSVRLLLPVSWCSNRACGDAWREDLRVLAMPHNESGL